MPQNYWIRVERGAKHPTAGYIGSDGPDPGGVTILVDGDLKPGHVTRVITQLANLIAVNHVGKLIRSTPAAPAQKAEPEPKAQAEVKSEARAKAVAKIEARREKAGKPKVFE